MLRVVLDTNILVSSLLSAGPPAVIVDLVADGKITLFYSDPILREYRDVLSRKKFNFSPFQVTRLIHDIVRTGISTAISSTAISSTAISSIESNPSASNPSNQKTLDKDGQFFFDAAVEARSYLITGNIKHFPQEPFVVTPARFLAVYQSGGK